MKFFILGALLAILITQAPGVAMAVLGLLGAALVAAASQPLVLAFVAGAIAWPRIADRFRRWTT